MEFGKPVFSLFSSIYLAAQGIHHALHAVADAKNRNTWLKNTRVHPRAVLFIDACRTSGQDDSFRSEHLNLVKADPGGVYLTIDMGLTHPPGNELVVLGAKVYD